jgi:murein DD-endopeptidase MepM/ murein hydrolase activator NlpD
MGGEGLMGAPALQAAGAALGARTFAPRALAAAGLALLGLLMLIVAPLALLSSTGGPPQITSGSGPIPAGLVPVFNEAARVYAVNAFLLASIADQESTFGTGPGWRTVNSAGCIGLMQMCVGGAGGDSWSTTKYAYRRGERPASYSFKTDDHPDVLDSFDNVMAAAVHLRGKVGGRPIPRLDGLAYRALCGYYGACSDGIAGNYAADVLNRARTWERQASASGSTAAPALGQTGVLAWPVRGPVTSLFCEHRTWEACHPGVDIGVPSGTPILAAAAGRVSVVQSTASSGGYGNLTCLQHTGALSSCYAHQQRFLVHVGQLVGRGQPIGISDCTGRCYGPHLHFEARLDDRPVCPAPYLGVSSSSMCAPGSPGS